MKCAIEELSSMMKKKFADEGEDKVEAAEEGEKDEMAGDEMEFDAEAAEEGGEGIHIDIGSHDEEAAEEEAPEVIAQRSTYGLRARMARIERENAALKGEITRARFEREIDSLEAEGYRIPEAHRPSLVAQLQAARDPLALMESWRELFARDPIGTKIDMSRASMPKASNVGDIAALVREHAGKPEEFVKAINARITKR